MLLGEIITLVHDTIRRPDKEALIDQRILQAVRATHAIGPFPLDRVEWIIPTSDISFNTTDPAIGHFDQPRDVRLPEIVQPLDASCAPVGDPLKLIEISEVIKCKTLNGNAAGTAYRVDGGISFHAHAEVTAISLTGITHRPAWDVVYNANGTTRAMTDSTITLYTDWLLDYLPLAVVDNALGFALASVGEAALSRTHLALVAETHIPVLDLLVK